MTPHAEGPGVAPAPEETELRLDEVVKAMSADVRHVFLAHLRAGTSATYLADWLGRAGSPVTQTAVHDYRRRTAPGGMTP